MSSTSSISARNLREGGGLSSYPHPYLMPEFWQFPTVSMGLGPIMSIYQARFNRYLRARSFIKGEEPKVWCFIGDGETDEPETLGSLTLGSRENLDNLIWVINCNLQRLDGPIRGNGKIIQELEALFNGAGWNVIKVIWGSDWDDLLARDKTGLLLKRMGEVVDGDYQKYSVEPGSYTRKHFFGKYPELLELVNFLTDEQIRKLLRGGHDTRKVYAAYKAAMAHKGTPTVILAKTIKGYGLAKPAKARISHTSRRNLTRRNSANSVRGSAFPSATRAWWTRRFTGPRRTARRLNIFTSAAKSWAALPARVEAPPLAVPNWNILARCSRAETPLPPRWLSTACSPCCCATRRSGGMSVPIIPDEARTFRFGRLVP